MDKTVLEKPFIVKHGENALNVGLLFIFPGDCFWAKHISSVTICFFTSSVCLCVSILLSPIQEQFSQVLDAMFELRVQPQEHVIDQGDDGDNFYVIER